MVLYLCQKAGKQPQNQSNEYIANAETLWHCDHQGLYFWSTGAHARLVNSHKRLCLSQAQYNTGVHCDVHIWREQHRVEGKLLQLSKQKQWDCFSPQSIHGRCHRNMQKWIPHSWSKFEQWQWPFHITTQYQCNPNIIGQYLTCEDDNGSSITPVGSVKMSAGM